MTPEQMIKLFIHRSDVFAVQTNSGAYFPIRRPITIKDIEKHLKGEMTIGAYCLNIDNTVKWACVDMDEGDLKEAETIYNLFFDYPRMLEESGRKGFHIWIFFKKPIKAEYAQKLVKARLNRIGLLRHEVFPKQTELNEGRKYGNLVKLPLSLHKVSRRFSKIIKQEI